MERSVLLNQKGSRISILSWLIYGALCALFGMVLSSYANTYSIPDYSDWESGTYTYTDNSSGINIAANMLHVVPQSITITNPDAETADTTGWSCQDSNGGACGVFSATTDNGPPYAGSYHFKIWDATYSSIMQQSVTVTSGIGYKLQAYVKFGNATIRVRTGSYTAGVNRCESSAATESYTLLTCDFVAQETNLYIQLVTSGANGTSLMDNVSIVTILGTWESADIDLGYSTSVSAVKWYGDETATLYWDTNTSGAKQIEIKCATTQGGLTSASYSAVSYNADPGCDTIQWVKVKVTGQLTAAQDTLKRPHLWGIDVIYNDPTDWTGRTCTSKKQLQVDNNDDATLTAGWVVDVIPGVFDISVSNPTQISIVRYTGSWTEVDRSIRGKMINFKTQADIAAWSSDKSYWLYYGCSTGSPQSDLVDIYSFSDNFDDNSFSASWTRKSLALQVGDEFDGGGIDAGITTVTSGGGSITETTGESEPFTSSIPATFTTLTNGSQTISSTSSVVRSTITGGLETTDDAGIVYRNEQSYRRFFFEPATVSIKGYVDDMSDGTSVYLLGMWDGTPAITTTATFLTKRMLSVEIIRSGASYTWRVIFNNSAGHPVYWSGSEWLRNAPIGFGSPTLDTWYNIKLIVDEQTVRVRIEDATETLIEETDPIGIFGLGVSDWTADQLYWFWGEPSNNAGWAKQDADDFAINWGVMKIITSAEADTAVAMSKVSDGSGKWADLVSDISGFATSMYNNATYGGAATMNGIFESSDTTYTVGCANETRFAINLILNTAGTVYSYRIIYCNTSGTQYYWNGSSWTTTATDLTGGTPALYKHNRYVIECTNADGCRAIIFGADGTKVYETDFVVWSTIKNDAGISDANNWYAFTGEYLNSLFYSTTYVDHFRVYKPGTSGVVEQNTRLELTATGKHDYTWVQKASASSTVRRLYSKITTTSGNGQRLRIGLAFDSKNTNTPLKWVAGVDIVTGSASVLMWAKNGNTEAGYIYNGVANATEAISASATYEAELFHLGSTVYFKLYKTSDNSLIFSQAFGGGNYTYTGNDSLSIYPTIMVWNDNNVSSSIFYIDDYGEATMRYPAAKVFPFERTNKVGFKHQLDDAGRVWYTRDTRLFYSSDELMEDENLVIDFNATIGATNIIEWIWLSKDYGSGQYIMVGTQINGKFYISTGCTTDPSDPCDTSGEWNLYQYSDYIGASTGCTGRPQDIQSGTYVGVLMVACYGLPTDNEEHLLRATTWRDTPTISFTDVLNNPNVVLHTHHFYQHKNTGVMYTGTHVPAFYKSTDGGQNWTKILDKNILLRESSIASSTAIILPDDDHPFAILATSISGSGSEEITNYKNRLGVICNYCNYDGEWWGLTWDGNNSRIMGNSTIYASNTQVPYVNNYTAYSDNDGVSYELLYDLSRKIAQTADATKSYAYTFGWISFTNNSLYKVFLENGTHRAAGNYNYNTLYKSNFTVKLGRSTPVKGFYERMQHFNDSFYGGY